MVFSQIQSQTPLNIDLFFSRFSGRLASFWVSWHENLQKNCFREYKTSFMRKQNGRVAIMIKNWKSFCNYYR